MPRLILTASRGYLSHTFYGFSIPLLVRTLAAPWRRDVQSLDNLPLGARLQVIAENLVSRFFGLVVRLATLGVGFGLLIVESLVFGLGLLLWLALPFVIVLLLILGIRILVGGSL